MARVVLPVVGAIVGAFYGNPQLGWAIGAAIGNAVDPQKIKGPSIGDIAQQTSSEGGARPFIYALSQPIAGNVIATSEPKIVKKSQSQGKGGPKVETESVYRTYAVGVAEGPITAFVKVWRNGILVYDARNGNTPDNVAFLQKARFFLGSYDQLPSPDLEVVFGVGNTPAHRGTAYMVVADDDLTDFRGAIPQYMFQLSGVGSMECETVTDYSNEVLYPWNLGGSDPRNPLNAHRYNYPGGGGDGFETLEEWLADFHANFFELDPRTFGWSSTSNCSGGVAPLWPQASDSDQRVALNMFFNYAGSFDLPKVIGYTFGGTCAELPTTPTWSMGLNITEGTLACHGVGLKAQSDDTGGTCPIPVCDVNGNCPGGLDDAWGKTDSPVTVRRVPTAPTFVCTPAPDVPGYCLIEGGKVVENVPWSLVEGAPAFNTRVLRRFNTFGAFSDYVIYPLSPARPFGHPEYDDQAFWEAAYEAAVEAGDMAPGLVYGVNYPEMQHFYYQRTYEECLFVGSTVPLQDVVSDICERAGLPAGLIDVSLLSGNVRGFTVSNQYPAYAALQALSEVFLFDPSNRDGKIVFVPRGANSVATITEADLLEDEQEIEQDKRGDPIVIPRKLHINYHDVAGGLSTDKQTSERAGDRRSVGEQSLQTAVLLNADEAARAIVINHKVLIEDQKGELRIMLPDRWLKLTAADNVILQYQGKSVRARITKADTLDGYQDYTLLRDRQSAYTSNVEGIPAAPQTPPPSGVVGPTLIQLLDIHILRDVDDSVGLAYYVAVAGLLPAWQGALVELSYDAGANYVDSATTTAEAIIGETVTDMGDHPHEIPDMLNTFRVRIDTEGGELQETDLAGLLNRQNLAIVGDELIQFANAEEVEDGVWELSYLLRGRKGSTASAHGIGSRFVLLDRNVLNLIPASITDIGRTLTFRATSLGASVETGTVVSMLFAGRTQIEREVGYLAAHRSGANMVVSWQGIGRLGSGASVAHGARFDGYRVTFSAAAGADIVVDTAAQAVTQDVSSLSSPVTIRVQQLNELTGPGPSSEVIVV